MKTKLYESELDRCIDRFMQKLVRVFLIGLTVVMVIGGIIAGFLI